MTVVCPPHFDTVTTLPYEMQLLNMLLASCSNIYASSG